MVSTISPLDDIVAYHLLPPPSQRPRGLLSVQTVTIPVLSSDKQRYVLKHHLVAPPFILTLPRKISYTDLHAILCKDQILGLHLLLAVLGQIVCEDVHLLRRSEPVSTTAMSPRISTFQSCQWKQWGGLTWYPTYAKTVTTANRMTRGISLPRTPIMTRRNKQRRSNSRFEKSQSR